MQVPLAAIILWALQEGRDCSHLHFQISERVPSPNGFGGRAHFWSPAGLGANERESLMIIDRAHEDRLSAAALGARRHTFLPPNEVRLVSSAA